MRQIDTPLTVDVLDADALGEADVAAWRAIQAGEPAFANPLYGPDFARIVGMTRGDARIAVFRRDGRPVGFFGFHRRPGGFARPIGAPFCDYQALVASKDLGIGGERALALAGLSAMRFNGLADPHGLFELCSQEQKDGYLIVLDGSAEAYFEQVRAASPKKFKNYRRLENRLEREIGALRMVADDLDPLTFEQIIAWKRDQFRRTGVHDVLGPDWTRAMMRTVFEARIGDTRGLMMSLYAGKTLVAGHFGIRQGEIYHPWIASANPDMEAHSPGNAFLHHAIQAMPQLGLTVYDLGPGHDHYKRPYASQVRQVSAGLATAGTVAGRIADASEKALGADGLSRIGGVGKVRRRLDQIAAVETSVGGRLRGIAAAARGMSRRGGNEALSPEGA